MHDSCVQVVSKVLFYPTSPLGHRAFFLPK